MNHPTLLLRPEDVRIGPAGEPGWGTARVVQRTFLGDRVHLRLAVALAPDSRLYRGSLNRLGTRRRSILISYFAEPLYASYLQTRSLRGIGMDASERFEPADFPLRQV